MKKQTYHYQTIDKVLIVFLGLWSVYTLFGHTFIHAMDSHHHDSSTEHIHMDGSSHVH